MEWSEGGIRTVAEGLESLSSRGVCCGFEKDVGIDRLHCLKRVSCRAMSTRTFMPTCCAESKRPVYEDEHDLKAAFSFLQ